MNYARRLLAAVALSLCVILAVPAIPSILQTPDALPPDFDCPDSKQEKPEPLIEDGENIA